MALLAAAPVPAQTFTVLHRFLPDGVDGVTPSATLTLNDGVLYGITVKGGTNNGGTAFRVDATGANYQVLHHFAALNVNPTNLDVTADGSAPMGGLTVADGAIYGATEGGGAAGRGALYKAGTNGADYQVMHHFIDFHDGSYPGSRLFLTSGFLYGSCFYDGGDNRLDHEYVAAGGTQFVIGTNGGEFQVLSTFQKYVPDPVVAPAYDLVLVPTNAMNTFGFIGVSLDGGGLGPEMQSIAGINIVGGGGSAYGSIYGVSEGGTFFHYHKFTGGADGAYPAGSGVLTGGFGSYVMYGVTAGEGTNTAGTVYRYDIQNDVFQVLHTFINDFGSGTQYTNGTVPVGKLVLMDNKLYGVTKWGGGGYANGGYGVLYRVNTDGTDFKVLHRFDADKEGGLPLAGLLAVDKVLYGTTTAYGSADGSGTGQGTIFKFDLNPPPLWLKPVPVFVITNQVIAITNPFNTIHPVVYITNHLSYSYPSLAVTWNLNDGLAHTLLKSSDMSLSISNWTPVPPNWTNQTQVEAGALINPNPGDPPTFFRLHSIVP